jgi:hypothetical protein
MRQRVQQIYHGMAQSVVLYIYLDMLTLQHMTMMFEVQDLSVASPATVSRCGMVYLEPSYIGLQPFVECWLRKLHHINRDKIDTPKHIYIQYTYIVGKYKIYLYEL